MLQPKNGLYLTHDDFPQWQDQQSKYIESYNTCIGDCINCKQTYKETHDNDLKVKNITFVVTEQCNLACTYCYECHKTNAKMSKKVAKDAVDFLFNEEKVNGYYNVETSPAVILEFIGGEPLLEIDLINYIVEYFKFKAFSLNHPWSTNYMISLTTNGILYENKKVQDFLKHNPNRVSVGLTIDGNKKLHDSCRMFPDGSGSYDIVEKSVKKWIQNQIIAQTKITLSPNNIKYLNEALQNIRKLNIRGAFTNCVFEEGWTLEHAKILYNEMKKLADFTLQNNNYKKYYCSLFDNTIGIKNTEDRNWCGGNGSMLAIGTDGRCFPCIRFMKYSLSTPGRKEQSIGDIYSGLESKDKNKWLNQLKKITMTSQCQYEDNNKCLTCPISKGCALCTGYNYDKFGNPNHKATFICVMHQARVLANVYYWNKLYQQLKLTKHFDLNIPDEWALQIISKNEYTMLKTLANRR